jgi:hypothetical protein
MEKDGIVLVMNIAENIFLRTFGFLLRFLKGNAFLQGTHVLKHRVLKFLLIRFDAKPDFKSFRIIIAFLKNTRSGQGNPDVRGFWKVGSMDTMFPEELRGKMIMLYNPDNSGNLNLIKMTSEDGLSYSMDTSRDIELIPEQKPEKEYLSIDFNIPDFDPLPVNLNASVLSLFSDIPRPFKIALLVFIAFFVGMFLLTIILSFF